MKQKYAAIDLGAESGRVVVGLFNGEKLTLEETHRFANVPVRLDQTLHWDILSLWHSIGDGLGKAASAHGSDLSGIGADTWGVDFALLDQSDALLGNPVHYRDARTDGMMQRAFETLSREKIFGITGLQFMPFNSLFQLLALKEQGSPQLEIARTFLFLPDLLHFWLSGEKANEYTIASTSQMLDAHARDWSGELLRAFDLPQIFPAMKKPGTQLGTIRQSVAERSGLAQSTPVFLPGCHDTASAIVAVPFAPDSRAAYLSSGTWSLMGIEVAEPIIDARTQDLQFTNEGGAAGTIRLLKNIAGLWLVQECRRIWAREGREFSYAELARLASEASPLQSFIEPDDAAFAAPQNMPAAIRDYCNRTNQTPPDGIGATVRCCLESLALKYRWAFENLGELQGAPLEVLHIVGGGSQNTLLNQLAADSLGCPVICGPIEATAAGNILTQMMARGEIANLADARAIVRCSFELETYQPRKENRAAWNDAYAKFLTFER